MNLKAAMFGIFHADLESGKLIWNTLKFFCLCNRVSVSVVSFLLLCKFI